MEKKNKKEFLKWALLGAFAMCIIMCMLFGIVVFGTRTGVIFLSRITGNNLVLDRQTRDKLSLLEAYVDKYYLYGNKISKDKKKEETYKGFIRGLNDPYSEYYDKEESKKLQEVTSGEYCGIGTVLHQNQSTKEIVFEKVYDDSPAKEAGVKEKDVLYKIEKEDVTDLGADDVVNLLRGEEGSKVKITVKRNGKEIDLKVKRRKIEVETVSAEVKENNIGYIRISSFESVTFDQYKKALDDLQKKGIKGLVVDLRGNPGGNLVTVCSMLELMLPENLLVYMKDKNGAKTEYYSETSEKFSHPVSIIVNGHSASASEIFAGTMQDYKAATIVGETTYGKGVVQQIMDLKDGTNLKLTIAEYYTPKGRAINGKGIKPDEVVKAPDDLQINTAKDTQLKKALEIVKKQMK